VRACAMMAPLLRRCREASKTLSLPLTAGSWFRETRSEGQFLERRRIRSSALASPFTSHVLPPCIPFTIRRTQTLRGDGAFVQKGG